MEFFFPGKNTRVGCHFLLQGIFPTQGWNPHLLHWQADSWSLHHLGSPEDISYPYVKVYSVSSVLLDVSFSLCWVWGLFFMLLVFHSGCWVWLSTHLCPEIWGYPVCETCDSLAYPRRLTAGQGWVVLVTACTGGCPSGQGWVSALGCCPECPLTATTCRHTTLTWPGLLRGHKESQILQPLRWNAPAYVLMGVQASSKLVPPLSEAFTCTTCGLSPPLPIQFCQPLSFRDFSPFLTPSNSSTGIEFNK